MENYLRSTYYLDADHEAVRDFAARYTLAESSDKEKAIALIEVANNAKNELTDEDDKKYYDLYINDVKRQNKITNAELNKVAKSGEQPGFWSSYGKGLWGGLRTVGNLRK